MGLNYRQIITWIHRMRVRQIVYIIGIASSEAERDKAINVASDIFGVEEVIDYVVIKTSEI